MANLKLAKLPDRTPAKITDDRTHDNAPAFRVLVGNARIGNAWEARTNGDNPKYYLRVRLDDPSLSKPFTAALFPSEGAIGHNSFGTGGGRDELLRFA